MFIVYGGLFFLLFGRIVFIQVTGEAEGKVLAALAENKYAREAILTADRGKILDRNGELIASDTLSYRLVAVLDEKLSDSNVTRHVDDPEKAAAVLAKYLPLDKEELVERLTRSEEQIREGKKKQVEFGSAGRNISHETVLAIREEKIPGIQFIEYKKRFYPNGNFASYLIGFAQEEEDDKGVISTVGKMGLEATYNKQLTGENGKVNFKSDRFGVTLPKADKQIVPAKDGLDIKLTIDKTIQNLVEDAMNEVDKEYSPDKMLVIVANPKTGAILAMSQRPSFDPSTRVGLTSNWLNEAVENTIEPGSTMKIFTLAAAIEENKWDPNATFKSGQYKIYDRTIRDHVREGWGTISFLEGFQRSSNVSMAYLLERLGDREFIKYINKFGFGAKTGIDLPKESAGIILDRFPSERLTTSYGQGSTITPIQMIQAVTAIANDGVMMQPYVIDEIYNPNTKKVVESKEPEEKGKPISKETARKVREALATTVTSDAGTGKRFALNGYTVGGKTGTAEIPSPNGGYLSGGSNFLYSFIGMAPIEDPQLVTYVLVQHPKLEAGEYGSDPVSKLFTTIMESSLKYLNIIPDDIEEVETNKLGNFKKMDSSKAIEKLKSEGFSPVLIGEGGKITNQYPENGALLTPGSVVLLTTEGQTTLPDFTGWSKKTLLSFKMLSGLDIRITGDGFVTEQSLTAGTIPREDEPIVIHLQRPSEIYKIKPKDAEEMDDIIGG
ncbi:penicillin-binding protein [Sporosarcina jiandibaonis]|uniref:penicillin-binding protein n=1 Tax=Sporosarcina jiandibaonis TaxID=2715535 RepID=UPI0015531DBD|nr:penicillin-binding protein [Sporosarcina jiandibaonis]